MAASVRMRNTLTLFSSNDDVLCHRVRLVLAAKGVTFDFVPVDPQNPPEDLIDLNPYHSVPTLVERELVLYAASVVSEYLDERYPHPPLMPVDPLSRARIRLAMLRIEHDWVPQVQAIQLGNKTQAEAGRKRLKELLTASLPLFKASKFFLNPEMSLADCAMAPIIWRLQSLDVPLPKDGKAIEDYGNRIFRHPGFVRSLTDQEKKLRDLPVVMSRLHADRRAPSAGGRQRVHFTHDRRLLPHDQPPPVPAAGAGGMDQRQPADPAHPGRRRRPGVQVPPSAVKDGRVVLNIAERAVVRLMIDNEMVSFSARFSGTSYPVQVPISAVLAVYARETGQGMALPDDIPGSESADQRRAAARGRGTPPDDTPPASRAQGPPEPARGQVTAQVRWAARPVPMAACRAPRRRFSGAHSASGDCLDRARGAGNETTGRRAAPCRAAGDRCDRGILELEGALESSRPSFDAGPVKATSCSPRRTRRPVAGAACGIVEAERAF
jgi:RNA polymerase-associated protein